MWLLVTLLFGWYLQRFADYSIIYGSLGAGIALLVWMYMISLVILMGAEFNAMLFPRALRDRRLLCHPRQRGSCFVVSPGIAAVGCIPDMVFVFWNEPCELSWRAGRLIC